MEGGSGITCLYECWQTHDDGWSDGVGCFT